ncbi:BTB/POZ protein [Rhizophagus irregularis DAOM 181602=DAOM 197198]|nr:BTB/POZ protein [Rhizophagus irregularis DAOM 181602=DAOM 197198]
MVAASEFDLQELVNHLQSFLIQKNTSWIIENFSLMYQTSLENNSLTELQNYCNDLVSKKPVKIFNSNNFSSIPENILISLIQNDNLNMNEVRVWKHVLKWGLDQNPGLPSDPESFSGDDFKSEETKEIESEAQTFEKIETQSIKHARLISKMD